MEVWRGEVRRSEEQEGPVPGGGAGGHRIWDGWGIMMVYGPALFFKQVKIKVMPSQHSSSFSR